MEIEPDYVGLQLVASAGYDPRVVVEMHHKLKKCYENTNISLE